MQPNIYAKLNLLIQNTFNSKHSLVLWEFLLESLCSGKNVNKTEWIDIEDYKKLLGIEGDGYQKFKELSRVLVKKPLKEINEKSDVCAKEEYQRKGRKVVALRFDVQKQDCQVKLKLNQYNDEDENKESKRKGKETKIQKNAPLLYTLIKKTLEEEPFSLTENEVDLIISVFEQQKDHSLDDFEEAIFATKENLQKELIKVKNVVALLRVAIKEKWQPKIDKITRRKEEQEKKLSALSYHVRKAKEGKDKLLAGFDDYLRLLANNHFEKKLSDEKREQMMQQYIDQDTELEDGEISLFQVSKDRKREIAKEKVINELVDMIPEEKKKELFIRFQKKQNTFLESIESKLDNLNKQIKQIKNLDLLTIKNFEVV